MNANNNPAGLEEYVDILQVQQLLLDSTSASSTTTTSNPSTSSSSAVNVSGTARHRPRVNIQKATEYSTTISNATNGPTTTTSSAQIQGKKNIFCIYFHKRIIYSSANILFDELKFIVISLCKIKEHSENNCNCKMCRICVKNKKKNSLQTTSNNKKKRTIQKRCS